MHVNWLLPKIIMRVLLVVFLGLIYLDVYMAQGWNADQEFQVSNPSEPQSAPSWQSITVDSQSSVERSLSMKLDKQNQAHISYVDITEVLDADLKYAYRVGTTWQIETIDAGKVYDQGTSLALDRDGNPHVAYIKSDTKALIYARLAGNRWITETVYTSSGFFPPFYPSLALDSQDYPHISFSSGGYIQYIYKNAAGWQAPEKVQYVYYANMRNSLALDQSGRPHISYEYGNDRGESSLRYAYKDGDGWEIRKVEDEVGANSLALDRNGYPHIGYVFYDSEEEKDKLKHAYQDSSGWHDEVVDSEDGIGALFITIDSQGQLHISYSTFLELDDSYQARLNYANKDSGGWHTVTVDPKLTGGESGYSSIDIDSNGFPHIAYSSTVLKYAWFGYPFEPSTNYIYLPLVVRSP